MSVRNNHPAFEPLRHHRIDSLQLDLDEFRHAGSGARHFHFASNHTEQVFMVALRTAPQDSTGVAHILEHTTLCGSRKYPVRDPFFMMTRRSLNTFMNAFTSSDWTAYPFASQNTRDFYNLMDVYLDAVFFPSLDYLDFRQEGHRLEFETPDNPESALVHRGVVYNEMKGAMSAIHSRVWDRLGYHLYPTTTYHFNSGGDPEHITDLTHEQLLQFYRRHYHPSNAIFMTFGSLPLEDIQTRIHEQVLCQFKADEQPVSIADEKRYYAPVRVQESYPLNEEDLSAKTHHVMGWLLGRSDELEEVLEAHLMTNVLLENSASPLMQALETTDLGQTPSALCGLEDSQREMLFVCGLEGSEPDHANAFEELVLNVLERVARDGVPSERLEAVLHQLELSQREISGDSYPYGLQLMLATLSPALEGVDPAAYLDLDPVLERLREKIREPDYLPGLVKRLLLNNPHRVRLSMQPDRELASLQEKAGVERLERVRQKLSEQQKQKLIEEAAQLAERQTRKDPVDCLPRVGREDVPADLSWVEPEDRSANSPFVGYGRGTNGLVYQQVIRALPEMNEDETFLLPLLAYLLPELGLGSESYLEIQERQSAISGGLNAYFDIRTPAGLVTPANSAEGIMVYSAKALARNAGKMTELLVSTSENARFDEHQRIREMLALLSSRKVQGVPNNGHGLAMSAASQSLNPVSGLSYRSSGLAGIQKLVKLVGEISTDKQALASLADQLAALYQRISAQPLKVLSIAESERLPELRRAWPADWLKSAAGGAMPGKISLPEKKAESGLAWQVNASVNYCALAFPTVTGQHEDAPALTALSGVLRNEFLHSAIREKGGAYGGGASQNNGEGVFRFYSYRDPRLGDTLDDFRRSIHWSLEGGIDEAVLEQAILGVVSSLDKPRSPAGEARHAFHSDLFGRGHEYQTRFRERVMALQVDHLKEVASKYLLDKPGCVAVVGGDQVATKAADLGLSLKRLEV